MASPRGLFLFDHMIRNGVCVFHGVLLDLATGKRKGHQTISVTRIPRVVHIGPFYIKSQLEEAEDSVKRLSNRENDGVQVKRLRRPETSVSSTLLPAAYFPGRPDPGDMWLELTFYDQTDMSQYAWAKALRVHVAELVKREKIDPSVMLYETDRNDKDSVLRLLSKYSVPGFYLPDQGHCDLQRCELSWAAFEDTVLKTQYTDDAQSNLILKSPLDLSINVAYTSSTIDLVTVFQVALGASCTSQQRIQAFSKRHFVKYSPEVDLVLVGVRRTKLDALSADISKIAYLSKEATHQKILGMCYDTDRVMQTDYSIVPWLVVPIEEVDTSHRTKQTVGKSIEYLMNSMSLESDEPTVHQLIFGLFNQAKHIGESLGVLLTPYSSSVSRRCEGWMTRILFRNGFKILPTETTSKTMPHAAATIGGGINAEVTPQYFANQHQAMLLDLNAYYGSIVTTFNMEVCSTSLWQTASEFVTEPAGMPRQCNISLLGDAWYKKYTGHLTQPDAAFVLDPIAAHLLDCLMERRRLSAIVHKTHGEIATHAYLKEVLSSFYGSIGSVYMRFQVPVLSELVTNIGRTLIQEMSKMVAPPMFPPRASVVLVVTDSFGIRYEPKQYPAMAAAVKRFIETVQAKFPLMEFSIAYVSHMILCKRNHYVFYEHASPPPLGEDGERVLAVKGFSPKHGDTPVFVKETLEAILAQFMLSFGGNDRIDIKKPMTTQEEEGFEEVLTAVIRRQKLSLSPPPPIADDGMPDSKYWTRMSLANARRSHFMAVGETASSSSDILFGSVVDYNPEIGFSVSATAPISQAAWEVYYLRRMICNELITILGACFPPTLVQRALHSALPTVIDYNPHAAFVATLKTQASASQPVTLPIARANGGSSSFFKTYSENASKLQHYWTQVDKQFTGTSKVDADDTDRVVTWGFSRTCQSCDATSIDTSLALQHTCPQCKKSINGSLSNATQQAPSFDLVCLQCDYLSPGQSAADKQRTYRSLQLLASDLEAEVIRSCGTAFIESQHLSGGPDLSVLDKMRKNNVPGSYLQFIPNIRHPDKQPVALLQKLSIVHLALCDHPYLHITR